jgi:UDP-3-O-[3-hydroxymyristoyl] glucosamine N-acyltransferase
MTLAEVSTLVNGSVLHGGDASITGVAKIEEAGPGDITFLANPKYAKFLTATGAGAVLLARGSHYDELNRRTAPIGVVEVDNPYLSFLALVDRFHPAPEAPPKGIHPAAWVAASAKTGSGVSIGPGVFVGEHAEIGNDVTFYAGTYVGSGARIGNRTLLGPNVSILEGCRVGDDVIVHAGTTIGSDGFGFAPKPDGTYEKIPQRGIVVVEDNVEIGANCAIDRATLGETRIGRGVKLDNLIHIAHNVTIGANTVIAAQTGISGSTGIGKNCIVAGQVGIVGHIRIGDRVTLAAKTGVSKSLTGEGKTYWGTPAREHSRALRIEGSLRQLPEMVVEMRQLQLRVAELEKRAAGRNPGPTVRPKVRPTTKRKPRQKV